MIVSPEAIQVSDMTPMQQLLMAQERISALKAELKAWQESFDQNLLEILRTAEFSEDRFLKTIKRNGESYREGNVKLIRSPRVQRTIRRDDFIMTFPEVFNRIAKVPLQQAEAAIGRDVLDGLCDKTISYSYEAVDMRPERD